MQIRIESGKFKGKRLFLPDFSTTRSTKSRVKACVFNTLRDELRGKVFVEVFGGSGAMAFEALSNEACAAYVFELDDKAYKIALKNATLLNTPNARVRKGDGFELLKDLLDWGFGENSPRKDEDDNGGKSEPLGNLLDEKKPIIAYFDPPFHSRAGFTDIYERVFALIISLQKHLHCCVIEHSSKVATPLTLGDFHQSKFKQFGKTSLSFYRK